MDTWHEILLILLGTILGTIFSIITTAIIEVIKKPALTLEIQNNQITYYDDNTHPAKVAKFLYIFVKNPELPWVFKWLTRYAAMQCHGTVAFYHLSDGTRVFNDPMPIRWTVLPSPAPEGGPVKVGNQIQHSFDMNKINHNSRVDIYPGNKESLNIAARFDEDEDCYGWTNENFISSPPWRAPRWKLPKGRYLVKVSILTAGEKCEKIFRLLNDVSKNDFRIEPALEKDQVIG